MNRKEIAIGDVYYAKVECNGSVQGGYRPYVVMQNDIGNKYSPIKKVFGVVSNNTFGHG